MSDIEKGDYVLATKYHDGDPGDQWAVGFYDGVLPKVGGDRYLVVDGDGRQFRRNGFRRVEKISHARGMFIVAHQAEIDASVCTYYPNTKGCRSLWGWKRAKMDRKANAK